jgi:hypothetical protein
MSRATPTKTVGLPSPSQTVEIRISARKTRAILAYGVVLDRAQLSGRQKVGNPLRKPRQVFFGNEVPIVLADELFGGGVAVKDGASEIRHDQAHLEIEDSDSIGRSLEESAIAALDT